MELVRRGNLMKEVVRKARGRGRKVGLVPTMGALHEGHLSLIRRVKELSDVTVVSVFVNPLQFDREEDLKQYPRTLSADVDACITEGVDYVFAPSVEELYPQGSQTVVQLRELATRLEGASRPGHFDGVATVVLKLLNVVRPEVAAFGQKDAQQVAVVRRMVRDLMLDVEILVLPVVRDDNGLALSSRNRRLSAEQLVTARRIPRALEAAREAAREGGRLPERIVAAAREVLEGDLDDGEAGAGAASLEVDYVELVDPDRFGPVGQVEGDMLLVVAVRVGDVRLLDNTAIRA